MEKDEAFSESSSSDAEETDSLKEPHSSEADMLSRIVFSSDYLSQVHHHHRYQTLQRLVSSRLLSMEDKQFLQDFVEELPPSQNPQENFTVCTRGLMGLLLTMTVLLNVSPAPSCLASVMVLVCPEGFFVVNLSPSDLILACLLIVNISWCLVVLGCVQLLRQKLQAELFKKAHVRDFALQQLETEAWELLHLERKCLRLLRESELVARGFTLASQQHMSSAQTRSQKSTVDKLCPHLRLTMLKQNSELLSKIQSAVVDMMKSISLRVSDSDFSTVENLADSDLALLTQDDTEENVIPLAPISKSINLLQIYISGCMRRLALCFYRKNLKDSDLNPFVATQKCVLSCSQALTQARSVLQEQYSFYRAVHQSMTHEKDIETGTRSAREQGSSAVKSPELDKLQHFYVCVNSLDLHLQSVLLMTRELSSSVETHLDEEARSVKCQGNNKDEKPGICTGDADKADSSVQMTTAEDWLAWEEAMKRIKSSLESVRCCYEESLKQLHHKDKNGESESPVASDPTKSCVTESGDASVKVIPADDPIIVDQVFEAVTDAAGDTDEEEDMAEWRRQRRIAAQDRAKIQEQREMMKRLRQELDAVVGHRALIQREREEVALARAKEEKNKQSGNTNNLDENQEKIVGNEVSKGSRAHNDQNGLPNEDSEHRSGVNKTETDELAYADKTVVTGSLHRETEEDLPVSVGSLKQLSEIKTAYERRTEADISMSEDDMEKSNSFKIANPQEAAVSNDRKTNAEISTSKDNVEGFNNLKITNSQREFPIDNFQNDCNNCLAQKDNDAKNEINKYGNKRTLLENLGLGVVVEPFSYPDQKDSTEIEKVPCISYSFMNASVIEDTKSLGVTEEENLKGDTESQQKPTQDFDTQEDTLSDSSTIVKNSWKRPAPPRICKKNGVRYVTPVNLITVGVVLHGGNDKAGGSNNDEDDDKKEDDSRDKGNRRRRHSSQSSKSESNSSRKRTSSKSDSGIAGAEGGHSSRLPTTEEEPVEVYGKWGDVEEANRKRQREFREHWTLCELELSNDKVETYKQTKKKPKNSGSQVTSKSTSTPKSHQQYSRPLLSPVSGMEVDAGPDPDLVGGFRFSPDDLGSSIASGGAQSTTDEDLARKRAAQEIVSPWMRKFTARVKSVSTSSGGHMRYQADIPLTVDLDAESFDLLPSRRDSRHNFDANAWRTRDMETPSFRRHSSHNLCTTETDSPWTQHSNTAPDVSSAYSDRTYLLSGTPLSSPPYNAIGNSSLHENSDADKWVKITHRKMLTDSGSKVQVIREKEVNMAQILAPGPSPVPSPNKDSSFTRSLAKLAAAQAHRMLRSDNINILGREEKFGDDSSSGGENEDL
ncbi:vezatin-like [Plakobranchus ocellatus]|uniref:Vezatin-like n=1 Tax=Plakobranchus ocellatus TaxID=259542 RepID=A0AAV4DM42_9GAST|nr:vezatin-like [Plakobranchus ocellatus]